MNLNFTFSLEGTSKSPVPKHAVKPHPRTGAELYYISDTFKILEVFRDGNISYAYSCILNLFFPLHRISYNNKNKLFLWFTQVAQRFFLQSVLIETCWIFGLHLRKKRTVGTRFKSPMSLWDNYLFLY